MDYAKITSKSERLNRLMNIHFSTFFEDMPLTHNQVRALLFIIEKSENGDVYPKDLEGYMSVRGSSVASLVNHLVQKGYITRESVAFDARFKRLVPTEKAFAVRGTIEERIDRYVNSLYVGLSDEELEAYCAVLDRIEKNIDNMRGVDRMGLLDYNNNEM